VLRVPTQDHLGWRLAVRFGDTTDSVVGEGFTVVTERAVSFQGDPSRRQASWTGVVAK
jgi:hypothetical protein